MSNLNYLLDKGWVNRREIEKTVRVKGGTTPSTVTWYEISSAGIDKIEGESEFKEGGKYAGINISAIGSNVIALGDGNVVNAEFASLHSELVKLRDAVANSPLDDETKFDISVDIETLMNQLAKSEPDKTIMGHVWRRIENIATIGGFADVVSRLHPLMAGLLI